MQQRGSWSSGLGFVLAAAGSAVGLGNLWKFPYITYANDGGAFVLVYLVCILIVGLPIMISEIMIGKKTQRSPVGAFREAIGERWSWIGGLGVFTGFVLLSFYSVVAGWTIYYFLQCLQWSFGSFPVEYEAGAAFGEFIARGPMQVGLAGAFMLVTIVVVSLGVSSGIERAARILLPILLGILLLLLVSALRMEGAKAALAFLFRPDFGELTAHSLLEALGHAFFTLSLGMGAMITYGSYMDRRESTVRSAGWVVVLDTVIAMLATVIMFSVIFTDPPTRASVGESTAGMLFITLPKLFYSIVPGGAFLAPLFYLLVGFAALTSTVSLLEVVSSYFIDERKTPRKRAAWFSGLGIFVVAVGCALSLGASAWLGGVRLPFFGGEKTGLFDVMDHVVANWLLPVGGLLVTLAAGWIMSRAVSEQELTEDPPAPGFSYTTWLVFIRFIAPLAVGAILVAVIAGWADFT